MLSASLNQFLSIGAFTTDNNGITLATWFRSSSSASSARILDFGNGESADNMILEVVNNDLWASLYVGSVGSNLDSGIPVNDDQWHHVAWVISPSGAWTVYIDGQAAAQLASGSYPAAVSRWINYLGRSNWPTDPYFNGAIRDFRMYQKSLSSAQVALLFSSTEVKI